MWTVSNPLLSNHIISYHHLVLCRKGHEKAKTPWLIQSRHSSQNIPVMSVRLRLRPKNVANIKIYEKKIHIHYVQI